MRDAKAVQQGARTTVVMDEMILVPSSRLALNSDRSAECRCVIVDARRRSGPSSSSSSLEFNSSQPLRPGVPFQGKLTGCICPRSLSFVRHARKRACRRDGPLLNTDNGGSEWTPFSSHWCGRRSRVLCHVWLLNTRNKYARAP